MVKVKVSMVKDKGQGLDQGHKVNYFYKNPSDPQKKFLRSRLLGSRSKVVFQGHRVKVKSIKKTSLPLSHRHFHTSTIFTLLNETALSCYFNSCIHFKQFLWHFKLLADTSNAFTRA